MIVGDDPKKFAAALVEYSKDKVRTSEIFFIYDNHSILLCMLMLQS